MSATDAFRPEPGQADAARSAPGGLLDVLGVAAVVLDTDGRIVFWSPQAGQLFGYTADEALGQLAGRLLVHEQHLDLMIKLFAQAMESGKSGAGVFPARRKDGGTRQVEFRNMRLLDDRHDVYLLGLATGKATVQDMERDLALSVRLVSQSPIGLAVMDTDLRYVTVNPALQRINGLPADEHIGRHVREVLPFLDVEPIEAAMREVLETGKPIVDQYAAGRTPADPDHDHAWSVSYHRLEAPDSKVLGVAVSVVDITERHHSATEAARARQRLAVIADASIRIGTTLDLERTAGELADVAVPQLADVAAVDVLDGVLGGRSTGAPQGPALFRALAVAAAYPTEAVHAADRPGDVARYDADRLVTHCVNTGRPVLVPHVDSHDLQRIARDSAAVTLLATAGVHSYLAVPLIARGEVLGALDLKRIRNPTPFDDDDALLASELAARAAVCIDNARWYQTQHHTALTLQRNLLPQPPAHLPGLDIACRYQPAGTTSEIGGDWYDAIPLHHSKTALVVGDVMGSGINAAATMGQLRTATRAFAELGLQPAQVMHHLDHLTQGVEQTITTCLYAVYDPHRAQCHVSLAGHLPPALVRAGQAPQLLDLPTGAPLGVGGVAFHTTRIAFRPGDQLVLYTDGLVETRHESIDARLECLLTLLDVPDRPLEETCDELLHALRHPGDDDDVALLIAQARPRRGTRRTRRFLPPWGSKAAT
ncbi:SpoIIE family protein phosphatase [Streptomyces sp. ISL-10]|uniref:SpoIIE family protein phosphatase n=1 Tax=Streptomyces sp. ISL-10 TaxID=2819172 RepID=UPI001BE56C23|nr:SpoIIE family protein phosphatase [Streptomyces sp. ISL-10]MBT2370324.1 SpoIIE family protein phosphatase [Streptomyces sp. ISL-10]